MNAELVQAGTVPLVSRLHALLRKAMGDREQDVFFRVLQQPATLIQQALENGLLFQIGEFDLEQPLAIGTQRFTGVLLALRTLVRLLPCRGLAFGRRAQHGLERHFNELVDQRFLGGEHVPA